MSKELRQARADARAELERLGIAPSPFRFVVWISAGLAIASVGVGTGLYLWKESERARIEAELAQKRAEAEAAQRKAEAEQKKAEAEQGRAKEETEWRVARQLGTSAAYENYLKNYPAGRFAEDAAKAISNRQQSAAQNEERTVWSDTYRRNTRDGYEQYLNLYPEGRFAKDAKAALLRIEQADDRAKWQEAAKKATEEAYKGYLQAYPNGQNAAEAKRLLAELAAAVPLQPDAEAQLKQGSEFRECPNCPLMVTLPAGEFVMGASKDDIKNGEADDDEGPARTVKIARPFAVGKFEVTFAEWDNCVTEGGCRGYKPGDKGWGRGKLPVINVSWDDAKLYVRWLSTKTGKRYRLLSEAEWEYSARAGSTTKYYFGDDGKGLCKYANVADESGSADRRKPGFSSWVICNDGHFNTAPVGSFAPNDFRLHDMLGNVSEWVEDVWHDNYQGAPTDGSAWTAGADPQARVGRGGSHNSLTAGLTSSHRVKYSAGDGGELVGFRVARTLGR